MPIPNSLISCLLHCFSACLFLVFALSAGSFMAQSDAEASDFLNVYNFTSDKAAQLAGAIPRR